MGLPNNLGKLSNMITSTGSAVGIGTSSPSALLDVNGNINVSAAGNIFASTTSGIFFSGFNSFAVGIFNDNSGVLRFQTGSTERMRITSGGNVGIGTSDATHRLTMQNGTSEVGIRMTDGTNNTYFALCAANNNFANGTIAGDTVVRATNGVCLAPNNGSAVAMRITSAGIVGIGTNDPSAGYAGTIANVRLALRNGTPGASNGTSVLLIGADDNHYSSITAQHIGGGQTYLAFGTSSSVSNPTERMRITSVGYTLIGTSSNTGFGSVHRISTSTSQGNYVLSVDGGSGQDFSTMFMSVSGTTGSASAAGQWVGRNTSTGRSINAGGTINASGADYAEYMLKAIEDTIAKGDIVGVNKEGKLTNIFDDSISFVVKSTDPSYVGGDTWGNSDAIGKIPMKQDDQTDKEYEELKAEYYIKLEEARAKVDRIAFSGQVPCNVYNANVGDYIIPINNNGKISGQAVTNPTFEQYQISVGKVWKIMEDGRAWVAVKIS